MAFNSNPANARAFPEAADIGLIMPMFTANSSDIYMKESRVFATSSSIGTFWTTGIDGSHTDQSYESVKLVAASDTSTQTIVDVSGSGILTHVLTPTLSATGTITVSVAVDGIETVFVSPSIGAGIRMMLGDFRTWQPIATAANSTQIGSSFNAGYTALTNMEYHMLTPMEAIIAKVAGMKFESSLKVTVKGSVNITSTVQEVNAAACYTTYIPEGL